MAPKYCRAPIGQGAWMLGTYQTIQRHPLKTGSNHARGIRVGFALARRRSLAELTYGFTVGNKNGECPVGEGS